VKKAFLITTIVVLVLLSLSMVGYAYAQTQTPPNPNPPTDQYTPGWRASGGMMGQGGMMGGRWNRNSTGDTDTDEYGPMHEYMIAAFAQAINLTPDELEARLDAGETMWEIAAAQGLDAEQFRQVMLDARTQALNAAVAAGAMTQEQADWMLDHMGQMGSQGFGPGSEGCPGMGGNFQGRMGGGRWNR
jgi:hypothetical protein